MARTPISHPEGCTSYGEVYTSFLHIPFMSSGHGPPRSKLGGVFDYLPDREIACDYHKRERKRRADDASAGECKSVTTCLTTIFHSRLPLR
jgi:hypothetical protein